MSLRSDWSANAAVFTAFEVLVLVLHGRRVRVSFIPHGVTSPELDIARRRLLSEVCGSILAAGGRELARPRTGVETPLLGPEHPSGEATTDTLKDRDDFENVWLGPDETYC